MRTFQIVEKITKTFEQLSVDSSKCSKVISGLSKCTKCIDVCPTKGLQIIDKEIELDHCIKCGLCAAKCPTGALKWIDPSFEKMVSLTHKYASENNGQTIIHCAFHDLNNSSINTIKVPCLGTIAKETWLALLQIDSNLRIYLPDQGCNDCHLTCGKMMFADEMATISDKPIVMTKVKTYQKNKDEDYDYSRRNWLSAILTTVKTAPLKTINNWAANEQDKDKQLQKSLLNDRRQAQLFLSKKAPQNMVDFSIMIPHMNEKCEFCTACSVLCPSQAITQLSELSIHVKPLLCSGCNLCVDICYFGAIELQSIPIRCENDLLEPILISLD